MNQFVTQILIVFGIAAAVAIARSFSRKWIITMTIPMNHRCIHSQNGKLVRLLDSGRFRFFGLGHQFEMFDNRLQQLVLQTQELTTLEGITIKTAAVGLYRVADPLVATSTTADYGGTLYTLIQLALRDAISGVEAESLLSNVRALGPKLLAVVQVKAADLGLELTELVIRDVIFPTEIKTVLSESWRAKKSALAEIEVARGKAAAARTMANAAKIYETHPALLKIRYIEALEQASKGVGNTFVVGMTDEKMLKQF
jgi:regulator of protease activity HflC (stomatin/prohibitin superfamily)